MGASWGVGDNEVSMGNTWDIPELQFGICNDVIIEEKSGLQDQYLKGAKCVWLHLCQLCHFVDKGTLQGVAKLHGSHPLMNYLSRKNFLRFHYRLQVLPRQFQNCLYYTFLWNQLIEIQDLLIHTRLHILFRKRQKSQNFRFFLIHILKGGIYKPRGQMRREGCL